MARFFRNPEAMWREEVLATEQVRKGFEVGEDVSDIGTSVVLSSGMMHAFNILGTEVWKRCDGKTLDDMVAELQETFDVDPGELREDVTLFLADIKERGLIYER